MLNHKKLESFPTELIRKIVEVLGLKMPTLYLSVIYVCTFTALKSSFGICNLTNLFITTGRMVTWLMNMIYFNILCKNGLRNLILTRIVFIHIFFNLTPFLNNYAKSKFIFPLFRNSILFRLKELCAVYGNYTQAHRL